MNIKTIISDEMQQCCYLIEKDGKGILIDPGLDTFKILRESQGLEVNYILLTHCHFDHIYSLKELRLGRKAVGSEKCAENITKKEIVLYNESLADKPCEIIMHDGDKMSFDGIEAECIYTPGHTDGSVCYLIGGALFSGDTLFYESVGRCDFPTGNIKELENSIKNKLYRLPNETVVYPGHGGKTSIEHEKKFNCYFTE